MPAQAGSLKTNFNRARGRQRTRLAWDEEILGAAPRRATILVPPDSSRAEQPAYTRRTGERYLVG
jgi:hypothetical protein